VTWIERLGLARRPSRVGRVSLAHCEQLASIHAGAFARPWGPDEFESFLTDSSIRLDGLFLGSDRQPSGFVVSRLVLDEAEILSLALARSARGRGESRTLLARHLQNLAHAGVTRVHLEVEEGNAPALALYRRAGFVASGHRPGYYSRPDGTRTSATSMTLLLAEPTTARSGP
jgi:ribosomal-protein-alanine N-acetyltransferase